MPESGTRLRFSFITEMRSPGSGGPSFSPKKVSQPVNGTARGIKRCEWERTASACVYFSFERVQHLRRAAAQARGRLQIVGQLRIDVARLLDVAGALGRKRQQFERREAPGIGGGGLALQAALDLRRSAVSTDAWPPAARRVAERLGHGAVGGDRVIGGDGAGLVLGSNLQRCGCGIAPIAAMPSPPCASA